MTEVEQDELNGWKHKYQELSGKIRGRDETIRRYLQTAIDAALSDMNNTDAMKIMVERVCDSIALLK